MRREYKVTGAAWMQCPGLSACSPDPQDTRKKDWTCQKQRGEGVGAASLAASVMRASGQDPRMDGLVSL